MITEPAAKPEHLAWNLRPRSRANEIGPQFSTANTMQIERLVNQFKSSTMNYCTAADALGKNECNAKQVKQYRQRPNHSEIPDLRPENYEDLESYEDACQRKIKIH